MSILQDQTNLEPTLQFFSLNLILNNN